MVSVHRGVAILLPALRSLPHGRRINRIKIQLKKSPVCLQTRPRALGAPAPAPANAGPGKKMTQEQRSRTSSRGSRRWLHSLGRAAYYGVVKSHEGSVLLLTLSNSRWRPLPCEIPNTMHAPSRSLFLTGNPGVGKTTRRPSWWLEISM